MTKLIVIMSTLAFLIMSAGTLTAQAEEGAIESLMKWSQCSSECVDQMDECMVKMKKQCSSATDKGACMKPCDDAYSACLGHCPKPNIEGLGGVPAPEVTK